jgi:hypothetical protein
MATGPVAPQQKKGLSPIAWIGIGCLGILILGGVAATLLGIFVFHKAKQVASEMEEDPVAATAKVLAAAHPDIEFVSADKEGRTVTFRDAKSGEELTFGYDDIEQGRVTFSSEGKTATIDVETDEGKEGGVTITTDDGRATFRASAELENIPEWVPLYPGSTPKGTFASEAGELRAGAFSFTTGDGLEDVLDYFAAEIERAGLKVMSRSTAGDGGLLVAASSDESRGLNVMVSKGGDGLEVVVNFTEKN